MKKTHSLVEELHLVTHLFYGFKKLIASKLCILWAITLVMFTIICIHADNPFVILKAVLLAFIVSTIIVLSRSQIIRDFRYGKQFHCIGFENSNEDVPVLYDFKKDENRSVLFFHSIGIPLEKWRDKLPELENAFNITIADVYLGHRQSDIIVECTNGRYDLLKKKNGQPNI